MPRWLLPENISDVLPREARRLEAARRALLDLYSGYGYELVVPPLIEYVDSLLTGTGRDLDLRTFKLVDQSSGRMLGLRADATPQVARIDAHILNRAGVSRLCYAGSVLHARPEHPLAVREPLQVGAELYGAAGTAADLEVLEIAVASLRVAGLERVTIDLGHTGVVRALLDLARLEPPADDNILAALSTKDPVALGDCTAALPAAVRDGLVALSRIGGGIEALAVARRTLPDVPAVASALDSLERLAERCGADEVTIDLADLHGYRYHTGVTFAVHAPELASAVLRGGRYDNIGRAFGRARPAVGFSIYLRELVGLLGFEAPAAILAPAGEAGELRESIRALRAAGNIVVQRLPGEASGDPGDFVFDRELRYVDSGWRVVARGGTAS
ncbi:MAG TPA: ATP phosphoribosyltransferase regulatory subunit [Burkholderiaceae bacterium]|nr:ATP phosphoribosyltransferase regulatory subunit [Burkholderiaceae bacterium]